jgi:hypothetical protein
MSNPKNPAPKLKVTARIGLVLHGNPASADAMKQLLIESLMVTCGAVPITENATQIWFRLLTIKRSSGVAERRSFSEAYEVSRCQAAYSTQEEETKEIQSFQTKFSMTTYVGSYWNSLPIFR